MDQPLKEKPKSITPFFQEFIPINLQEPFKKNVSLAKLRDATLLFLSLQVLTTILGITMFFARKITLYLYGNIFSLIAASIGTYGSLTINKLYVNIYAVAVCGVLGPFFAYGVLLVFIGSDLGEDQSDYIMMLILTSPYLIDFTSGVVMFVFFFKLDDFYTSMEEPNIGFNLDYLEKDLCGICMKNKRESVIVPCGHRLLCMGCAFRLKNHKKCPICRQPFTQIIKVYEDQ